MLSVELKRLDEHRLFRPCIPPTVLSSETSSYVMHMITSVLTQDKGSVFASG
jgi:hypothetical protein